MTAKLNVAECERLDEIVAIGHSVKEFLAVRVQLRAALDLLREAKRVCAEADDHVLANILLEKLKEIGL